jgi:SAM-dependent methyltransferase
MLFSYDGQRYPEYLKNGNACQFIAATAAHYCKGEGIDIGAGGWPLPGAKPIDMALGHNGMSLPPPYRKWDYVFSSHCLEHLSDPVKALRHWKDQLKPRGVLFLYLPHPDMRYWRPQFCAKHLHMWRPTDMAALLTDIGFVDVLHGERDLAWSFAAVGWNG